jgi:hypothetical protein
MEFVLGKWMVIVLAEAQFSEPTPAQQVGELETFHHPGGWHGLRQAAATVLFL